MKNGNNSNMALWIKTKIWSEIDLIILNTFPLLNLTVLEIYVKKLLSDPYVPF